jgi:predicted RNA-binding protein with PUA-like domain
MRACLQVSVVRTAYDDPADAAWAVVDIEYVRTFPHFVGLDVLTAMAQGDLSVLILFKQPRLSVQPVSPEHFRTIAECGTKGTP